MSTLNSKVCHVCQIEKPLTSEFWVRDSGKKSGYASKCKLCRSQAYKDNAERYKRSQAKYMSKPENRSRHNSRSLARYHSNPDQVLIDRRIRYNKDYRKVMLVNVKNRARQNGIEFNLELEDIALPEFCPVLGVKLDLSYGDKGKKSLPNSPSIDRIDPSKGYVKGNIQVMSRLANGMKSNASPDQLLSFAKWVNDTYAV